MRESIDLKVSFFFEVWSVIGDEDLRCEKRVAGRCRPFLDSATPAKTKPGVVK